MRLGRHRFAADDRGQTALARSPATLPVRPVRGTAGVAGGTGSPAARVLARIGRMLRGGLVDSSAMSCLSACILTMALVLDRRFWCKDLKMAGDESAPQPARSQMAVMFSAATIATNSNVVVKTIGAAASLFWL